MLKKITTSIIMLMFATLTLAQNVTIDTYGVTDREVAVSAEDIFDLSYNGLTNVGTGTKVYLKGFSANGDAATGQWLIVKLPDGSSASYGTTMELDANTQITSIVLDIAGTYTFQFSVGAEYDEITFNAGTYLGLPTGFNCATCHTETAAKWAETNHATTLERALKGTLSSNFKESCVRCHSTGYDANADNDGFDDRDFVFPSELSETGYNQTLANSPEAMKLANVQCESCHGPGSGHMGNTADSKIVNSISQETCAKCHDSGTHHVFPAQWDVSGHATLTSGGAGQTRSSCAPCHNGSGFVKYVKGGKVGLTENEPMKVDITCATCHDPHDATNEHQLRTVEATLANGEDVAVGGLGKLCMNCHKTRRDAVDYTSNYLNNLSSHYGPHYGPQSEILLAKNYPDLGTTFASSMHYNYTTEACVSCHMNNQGAVDAEGNVLLSGGHSFRMSTPDGVDNVAACLPCHSFESFDKISVKVNGSADLDGDGTEEGLQAEVHGMLEEIEMMLPPLGSTEISTIDSSWSPIQAKAFYIWEMVEADGSFGAHNAKFVTGILMETIAQLEGATTDVKEVAGLPVTYSLDQNYPNPFNPSTTIRFSVPEAGNVRITVYDVIGNEIEVLVDKNMNPGVFNATWDATNYASGIYLYRMQTNNFVSVRKMILVK